MLALSLCGCQWFGSASDPAPADTLVTQKVIQATPRPVQASADAPRVPAGALLIGFGPFNTMTLACPGRGVIYFVEDGSSHVVWASYVPDAVQSSSPLSQAPAEFRRLFKEDSVYRIYFQPTDAPNPVAGQGGGQ